MFVQISPNEGDVGETLCSLNFASRVRGVENGPVRKQLDSGELFKYKQLAERAKQDGRSKEETIKKIEESLRISETKLKAQEQMCQVLSDKVRENMDLEAQLMAEKRARLAVEASLLEQKVLAEKAAAESKLLSERAASESKVAMKKALENGFTMECPAHAKDSARLLKSDMGQSQVNLQVTETGSMMEMAPRRPPLLEKTMEYVVKPPDTSEFLRNSTGEVFGNENANPQLDVTEPLSSLKQSSEGKLMSLSARFFSPTPSKGLARRTRRASGFVVPIKQGPSILLNSLVRRSHDSASNSAPRILSDEHACKLTGGVDMAAMGFSSNRQRGMKPLTNLSREVLAGNDNSGTISRHETNLSQLLQQPSAFRGLGMAATGLLSRVQPATQRTVTFRSLPPPVGEKLEDLQAKPEMLLFGMDQKQVVTGKLRRATLSISKPFGKIPGAGAGAQRVLTTGVKTSGVQYKGRRWN